MSERILLIEDDVASMELMFHLLTAYGYSPQRARSGEQGLTMAAREPPQLIISGIRMPLMDGYEVARRIKANPALSAIPMIALVSSSTPEERARVLGAGFDGYLCKPFSPEALARHVQTFLRAEFRKGIDAAVGAMIEAPASALKGRKILVVDDTPANLLLSARLLRRAGYVVATANGMAEGLQNARDDPPDLIVSDVVMGDASGFQFIMAVKADPRLQSIPFVFNTASLTDQTARRKGLALGAIKFLCRPMAVDQMLREIEECLAADAAA